MLRSTLNRLGINPNNVAKVDGREVAESVLEHVTPKEKLEIGTVVKSFRQGPTRRELRRAIKQTGGYYEKSQPNIEKASGNVLDENVKIGRYLDIYRSGSCVFFWPTPVK